MEQFKTVTRIYQVGPEHWVGDGFHVSTIFSMHSIDPQLTSPFLLMDHAKKKYFAPTKRKLGVGEHPHRGFETVTFAIEGAVDHRDSGGGGGTIKTGGVQWMTAGSGVVHEEFHSREFAEQGGHFEMVQLWINLPAEHKMTKPRYQSMDKEQMGSLELIQGVNVKVVAGELAGAVGPAKTFSPIHIYELDINTEDPFEISVPENLTTLVFQIRGKSMVNKSTEIPERGLAVLSNLHSKIQLKALEVNQGPSKLLVLVGQPLREPVVAYGPFVMNTKEEIIQAMRDFEAGKMGQLVE